MRGEGWWVPCAAAAPHCGAPREWSSNHTSNPPDFATLDAQDSDCGACLSLRTNFSLQTPQGFGTAGVEARTAVPPDPLRNQSAPPTFRSPPSPWYYHTIPRYLAKSPLTPARVGVGCGPCTDWPLRTRTAWGFRQYPTPPQLHLLRHWANRCGQRHWPNGAGCGC